MAPPNPFLLAADNDPSLVPLLRENPALAAQQDSHGYSLVHAAASYDRLALLRQLVTEFGVPVDLRDEDGETALFVVETVAAARCLVEELGADPFARSTVDGFTARQRIEAEEEFPEVAAYLARVEAERGGSTAAARVGAEEANGVDGTSDRPAQDAGSSGGHTDPVLPAELPPPPEGLTVRVGTMSVATPADGDAGEEEVDPEFRRRIQELAERDDFHTPAGQAELRRLVEDAVAGDGILTAGDGVGDGRNLRRRLE